MFERGPIGAYYSSTTGCWDVKDNVFVSCKGSQPTTSTCSFTPSYNYAATLQSSDEVKETVLAYSGVGKLDAVAVSPQKRLSAYARQPAPPLPDYFIHQIALEIKVKPQPCLQH